MPDARTASAVARCTTVGSKWCGHEGPVQRIGIAPAARAARLVAAPFDSLSPVSARRLPVHPAGGYDVDRVPATRITWRDVLKVPAR
jgi:hypothetical protein